MLRGIRASRRVHALPALLAAVASLAAAESASATSYFTFAADPVQPALPAGSTLATVAGVTGTGIPDLVIENAHANTVGVSLGNGAGGFGTPSSIPVGGHPAQVFVADFNRDGHPDLLIAIETKATLREHNLLPEHVELLFGDGSGGFASGPLISLPVAGPVAIGDFNGDANTDLAVAPNGCYAGGNTDKYYTLLGDGHGNLRRGPTTIAETNACALEAADFTGDGGSDLVMVSEGIGPHEVIVLPGTPGGGFAPAIVTPASDGFFLAGTPADLNGDGKLDLILGGFATPSTFEMLAGDGSGRFAASTPYASGAPNLGFAVALGDFSGDGHIDIAAIGPGVHVLENDGAGAFVSGLAVSLPEGFGSDAFAADVNRDGRPDLVLAGLSGVSVLLDEPAPQRSTIAVRLRVGHRRHGRTRSLTVSGAVRLAGGATPPNAACEGEVAVRLVFRAKTLAPRSARLTSRCSFDTALEVRASRLGHRRITVLVSFPGDAYLAASSAHRRA